MGRPGLSAPRRRTGTALSPGPRGARASAAAAGWGGPLCGAGWTNAAGSGRGAVRTSGGATRPCGCGPARRGGGSCDWSCGAVSGAGCGRSGSGPRRGWCALGRCAAPARRAAAAAAHPRHAPRRRTQGSPPPRRTNPRRPQGPPQPSPADPAAAASTAAGAACVGARRGWRRSCSCVAAPPRCRTSPRRRQGATKGGRPPHPCAG